MKFYYLLHPRPVVIIGSGSVKNNEINFMAASWVTPISEDLEAFGFACYKENYTAELVKKYKQFSIIITNDIDLIWKVGTVSGREVNKVEKFGINVESGEKLDVPIIEDCLGFAECKLIETVEIGEDYFFIGEVVNWYAKNYNQYGWKEHWNIPLHKAGKAFTFPSKSLKFVK